MEKNRKTGKAEAPAEKKKIRALHLHSAAGIIHVVDLEPTPEAVARFMKYRKPIDVPFQFDAENMLLVDAMALANGHKFGFSLSAGISSGFAGDGLIVGFDGEKMVDCHLQPVIDLGPLIKFFPIKLDESLIPKGEG